LQKMTRMHGAPFWQKRYGDCCIDDEEEHKSNQEGHDA